MSFNISNQVAYLRTSRQFPEEDHQMSVEMNKAYIDIANAVNSRTIGLYSLNQATITGNNYFIAKNRRQQTLRRVYAFTTTTSIPHNIQVLDPDQFINCMGSYTNGTNSFSLPWATSVAIAGQITFYVTSTNIVFVTGAGAPALTSGRIVLEWLSSP